MATTYIVIAFRDLLARTLAPRLALRHQVCLHHHRQRKHRRDREPHEGQLPPPDQRPGQADPEHRDDNDRLREHSRDERARVVPVLDEDLYEACRAVLALVEPLLVLRQHARHADLADARDPAHGHDLHHRVFQPDEQPVGGGDPEDDAAVHVDDGAVASTDGDLEEDAGEQEGEDGGHRTARETDQDADHERGLAGERRVDIANETPERLFARGLSSCLWLGAGTLDAVNLDIRKGRHALLVPAQALPLGVQLPRLRICGATPVCRLRPSLLQGRLLGIELVVVQDYWRPKCGRRPIRDDSGRRRGELQTVAVARGSQRSGGRRQRGDVDVQRLAAALPRRLLSRRLGRDESAQPLGFAGGKDGGRGDDRSRPREVSDDIEHPIAHGERPESRVCDALVPQCLRADLDGRYLLLKLHVLLLENGLNGDRLRLLVLRLQEAARCVLSVGHFAELAVFKLLKLESEALLDEPSLVEHVHKIVELNLREVVGDHDGCHIVSPPLDGLEDQNAGRCVQRRCRFVCNPNSIHRRHISSQQYVPRIRTVGLRRSARAIASRCF